MKRFRRGWWFVWLGVLAGCGGQTEMKTGVTVTPDQLSFSTNDGDDTVQRHALFLQNVSDHPEHLTLAVTGHFGIDHSDVVLAPGEQQVIAVAFDNHDDHNEGSIAIDSEDTHASVRLVGLRFRDCWAGANPCVYPSQHPDGTCNNQNAADGTQCAHSDCITSQVCQSGQCVTQPAADGQYCGETTSCQAAGTCHGQTCELPAPKC